MDGNAPGNQLPHQVGDSQHDEQCEHDEDDENENDENEKDEDDYQGPGRDERIEELVDTLECPVCLDTADTPPVYQCPEGHLICKGGLVTPLL